MARKAVFLDRDGTLIKHYDYLTEVSQVELVDTATTALKFLKERGYLLILITNQSGVARGFLTEERLHQIHGQLKSLLAKQGAYLDGIYYCPFHPEAPVEAYRQESELRKPKPGMLLKAAEEFGVDLAQSWVIGDDDRDILAGQAAGCRTILVMERGSLQVKRGESQPDYKAGNLQEAANVVAHYSSKPVRQAPPAIALPAKTEDPVMTEVASSSSGDEPPQAEPAPAVTVVPTESAEPVEPTESTEPVMPDKPVVPVVPVETVVPTMAPKAKRAVRDRAGRTPQPVASRTGRPAPAGEKAILADSPKPVDTGVDDGAGTDELLKRILQELRQSRHDRRGGEDFSVFRLVGMVIQMVVVLCLVMALRANSGDDPDVAGAYIYLMAGMVFQAMALTFLTGFK